MKIFITTKRAEKVLMSMVVISMLILVIGIGVLKALSTTCEV